MNTLLALKEKYSIALRHSILINSEEINQQLGTTFCINPIPINFNVKLRMVKNRLENIISVELASGLSFYTQITFFL